MLMNLGLRASSMFLLARDSSGAPSPIIGTIITCVGIALLVTPVRFLPGINRRATTDSDRSHPRLFGVYLVVWGLSLLALYFHKSQAGQSGAALAGHLVSFLALALLALTLVALLATGVIMIRYPINFNEHLRRLHLSSIELRQQSGSGGSKLRARAVGIVLVAAAGFLGYFILRIV
jgi:hypothetical protein